MKSIVSQELRHWLILHLAPRFGPISWQRCLRHFSSPKAFCSQSKAGLLAFGCNGETVDAIKHPNEVLVEQALRWAELPNQTIITCQDEAYPDLLKRIAAPPPVLYVWGQLDCINSSQIAVVGTRRPTHGARQLAHHFGQRLGEAGLVTTSGLALGIDALAHQGALDTNAATIAVLGNGLQAVYPVKNRKIADKILENGAIISEFPLFSPPKSENFPRRNRIISGLSLGVLVIEAALKSGSLITARYALEQNREVFATPGSLFNSMSAGCHHLIQQGAHLVTHIDDILSEIKGFSAHKILNEPLGGTRILPPAGAALDKAHKKLLKCMDFDVISFEQLVDATGFSTQKVTALLCELTLKGYVKEELGSFTRVIA